MLRFTSYTNPIAELSGKQEGVFNEMNNNIKVTRHLDKKST